MIWNFNISVAWIEFSSEQQLHVIHVNPGMISQWSQATLDSYIMIENEKRTSNILWQQKQVNLSILKQTGRQFTLHYVDNAYVG